MTQCFLKHPQSTSTVQDVPSVDNISWFKETSPPPDNCWDWLQLSARLTKNGLFWGKRFEAQSIKNIVIRRIIGETFLFFFFVARCIDTLDWSAERTPPAVSQIKIWIHSQRQLSSQRYLCQGNPGRGLFVHYAFSQFGCINVHHESVIKLAEESKVPRKSVFPIYPF